MVQHWIWLSERKHLNYSVKLALLEHFGDPERIYFAREEEYRELGLDGKAVQSLLDKELDDTRKILEECRKKKIHVLTLQDSGYPRKLKNIPDPPIVLYYKGTLPDLDAAPVIGVVGTRKASAYGLQTARKLGYQIARCGGVVVSGLAKGIDAQSMLGALAADGPVVGVLGGGADVVYPAENRALFQDTEDYGCLLTEYPPGTRCFPQNFPHRNRIISGMSDGVLIVEAPVRSGALITADRAADQGRDVFVVPANVDVQTSAGSNALLRDGGIAVGCGWDILSEYESRYPGKIREFHGGTLRDEPRQPAAKVAQEAEKFTKKSKSKTITEKKPIDNSEISPYIDLTKILPNLSKSEQAIVSLLQSGQTLVDDVIAGTGLAAPVVLASLTVLEVKGIVRRLPGRFIELCREK